MMKISKDDARYVLGVLEQNHDGNSPEWAVQSSDFDTASDHFIFRTINWYCRNGVYGELRHEGTSHRIYFGSPAYNVRLGRYVHSRFGVKYMTFKGDSEETVILNLVRFFQMKDKFGAFPFFVGRAVTLDYWDENYQLN